MGIARIGGTAKEFYNVCGYLSDPRARSSVDRALASGARGRGFKSLRARHFAFSLNLRHSVRLKKDKKKEAALVLPPLLPGVCSMSTGSVSHFFGKCIGEKPYLRDALNLTCYTAAPQPLTHCL